MALWPLETGYYKFIWPLFPAVDRTPEWHTLRHNVMAVFWEMAVPCPLVVLAWRRRTRVAPTAQG